LTRRHQRKPNITVAKLQVMLPRIRGRLVQAQFYLRNGDCANFAIALGRVLGSKAYYAVYGDRQDWFEGAASHCTLRWKRKLWDGNGVTSVKKLKQRHLKLNRSVPTAEQDMILSKATLRRLEFIVDDERVDIIEQLIRPIVER